MEKLVLENWYKIVRHLFGAAYAVPNKGKTILYWFRYLLTLLSPTENLRIQALFKAFEWLSSTFKAYFIFKDFSRKPSKFKYFLSLCQPCKEFLFSVRSWMFSSPSFLTYVLGAEKNHLNETVLLSTKNICFDWEIRNYFSVTHS